LFNALDHQKLLDDSNSDDEVHVEETDKVDLSFSL